MVLYMWGNASSVVSARLVLDGNIELGRQLTWANGIRFSKVVLAWQGTLPNERLHDTSTSSAEMIEIIMLHYANGIPTPHGRDSKLARGVGFPARQTIARGAIQCCSALENNAAVCNAPSYDWSSADLTSRFGVGVLGATHATDARRCLLLDSSLRRLISLRHELFEKRKAMNYLLDNALGCTVAAAAVTMIMAWRNGRGKWPRIMPTANISLSSDPAEMIGGEHLHAYTPLMALSLKRLDYKCAVNGRRMLRRRARCCEVIMTRLRQSVLKRRMWILQSRESLFCFNENHHNS